MQALPQLLHRWQASQPNTTLAQIQALWVTVVGSTVALQAHPYRLERGTLWVATANSVWAQTLSFSRLPILTKLKDQLGPVVQEVRFAAMPLPPSPLPFSPEDPWPNHPSRLPPQVVPKPLDSPSNAVDSFRHWANFLQTRGRSLPPCPTCKIPTPPGELQRWGCCGVCLAKGL